MTSNMDAARAALKEIKRCAAHARSTGLPCQKPGTGAGGRCRHHGGLSTGRPIIHGRDTAVAKLNRESARLLVAVIHKLQGGKSSGFFKPGRLTSEQVIKVLEHFGITPRSEL